MKVLRPFTERDLERHVKGEVSWGHYLIDPATDTTKMFAFDIDADKEYRDMTDPGHPEYERLMGDMCILATGLCYGIKRISGTGLTLISYGGGKGLHVLGVVEEPTPSDEVRKMAFKVLTKFGCFEKIRGDNFWKHDTMYPEFTLEVFPKQDSVKKGSFGNLMRLPLGVNAKTGRKAFFVKGDTNMEPDDPTRALYGGSIR